MTPAGSGGEVRVLLFASAREAAGCSSVSLAGSTVGEVLDLAVARFGADFGAVLAIARVWVNGDEPEAGRETPVRAGDELAVLPPVSGG